MIFNGPVDKWSTNRSRIFGEAKFKIIDTLKATVGLRVSKLDFSGTPTGLALPGHHPGPRIQRSEKPVTPKAVLTWQPDQRQHGVRQCLEGLSPGRPECRRRRYLHAQSRLPLGSAQVPGQYSSDSLWSYEIGTKNTFLDHRLQINASLFYIDWSNIQQNVYLPACGEQFTANLGKAKSEGGDVDMLYRPIDTAHPGPAPPPTPTPA